MTSMFEEFNSTVVRVLYSFSNVLLFPVLLAIIVMAATVLLWLGGFIREALERRQLRSGEALRPRNFDYWYCGSPTLRPVAASDDGVHTHLRFGAHAELPAIFVRNDDGSESLLNFSVESGDVVIHRVAKRFILRRGLLRGCVVNKSFNGGGERLDSGTVSPSVERVTQGGVP